MAGLLSGLARGMRKKRSSALQILTSKKGPIGYYKGKNCKSTGFHTRKGGYVLMEEKLPHYIVPDLTGFKVVLFVTSLWLVSQGC
ncbi:uncharacterized protein LOC131079557 isoform X3 [Cryptomeria japonica]|uniref:uncharacterized protein LOC131079557 isoform X3 n=1 Tax=Cryptomeria japonica TaxID=3369 RepID=UPI0027DA3E00|nr:uncharacterized protein LOC131079557 isoform X3 [Cryptomeria japonica]